MQREAYLSELRCAASEVKIQYVVANQNDFVKVQPILRQVLPFAAAKHFLLVHESIEVDYVHDTILGCPFTTSPPSPFSILGDLSSAAACLTSSISSVAPNILVVSSPTIIAVAAATIAIDNNITLVTLDAFPNYIYNPSPTRPQQFLMQALISAASYHFVPSQQQYDFLLQNNVASSNIHRIGSTMLAHINLLSKTSQFNLPIGSVLCYLSVPDITVISALANASNVYISTTVSTALQLYLQDTNLILLPLLPLHEVLQMIPRLQLLITDIEYMQIFANYYNIPLQLTIRHLLRQETYDANITVTDRASTSSTVHGDTYAAHRFICHLLRYERVFISECPYRVLSPLQKLPVLIPRQVPQTHPHISSVLQSLASTPMPPKLLFGSSNADDGHISVILNVYKRNNIDKQLAAIAQQSIFPLIKHIFIYQDEDHVPSTAATTITSHRFNLTRKLEFVHSSYNFKFFGRFLLPLLLDTEFVYIVDDDILPGERWLEHCLLSCVEMDAIVGGAGSVIGRTREYFVWPPVTVPMQVDYLIRSWFLKTKWIKYLFAEHIPSWQQGEDILLSATLSKYGIKSIVPKQPVRHTDLWGDVNIAATLNNRMSEKFRTGVSPTIDEFAASSQPNTLAYRWELINYCIVELQWNILGYSICRESCSEYPLDSCYVYHVPFFHSVNSSNYCTTDSWGRKTSSIGRYDYITSRGNAVEVGAGLNIYSEYDHWQIESLVIAELHSYANSSTILATEANITDSLWRILVQPSLLLTNNISFSATHLESYYESPYNYSLFLAIELESVSYVIGDMQSVEHIPVNTTYSSPSTSLPIPLTQHPEMTRDVNMSIYIMKIQGHSSIGGHGVINEVTKEYIQLVKSIVDAADLLM